MTASHIKFHEEKNEAPENKDNTLVTWIKDNDLFS